jgi:hypothetical protein
MADEVSCEPARDPQDWERSLGDADGMAGDQFSIA